MNKRTGKKGFFPCRLLLEIKKKLYRKEWIELEDNLKLQKQQLMKIKILMRLNSERTL